MPCFGGCLPSKDLCTPSSPYLSSIGLYIVWCSRKCVRIHKCTVIRHTEKMQNDDAESGNIELDRWLWPKRNPILNSIFPLTGLLPCRHCFLACFYCKLQKFHISHTLRIVQIWFGPFHIHVDNSDWIHANFVSFDVNFIGTTRPTAIEQTGGAYRTTDKHSFGAYL